MPRSPSASRWFARLLRPFTGRLAVAVLCLCASSALNLVYPVFMGRSVDSAFVERSRSLLERYALLLVALFAFGSLLNFVETWLLQSAAAGLLRDLRARLQSHLLTLTPAFFDNRRTGELLSRLTGDAATLGNVLTRDLVDGLQRSLVLAGALVVLVSVHFRLTLVMLATVPPVVAAAVLFARRIEKLSEKEQDILAETGVAAEEALSGIRTVQAFVREPFERARYGERLGRLFGIELKAALAWGAFHSGVQFFGICAVGAVFYYALDLATRGLITHGQLFSFMYFTFLVATSVGSLTSLYGRFAAAGGATKRIRELLDTAPAVADAEGAKALPRPRGDVGFEGVTFQYPSAEKPAVDGVTLAAPAGTMLALVGPSGAGKTTLASLLLRFHDPGSGRVTVDGEDLRGVKLPDLRAAIGFVPQDVFLFGGTVAENIRYGKPEATEAEVKAAAEAAHAAEFIGRLPKAYETVVGERGVRLSTGERQRIAIARVFLKDPAIVVLDEATSALDAESESAVQGAFERLFQGRTSLVIAHRLATVRRATAVAVLDGGRVVERGTHEELLAKGGLYRRLCDLQMLS
ncbi:MAG: ABC transporter ATP-binding protein [Planctomycetia bacterium]|nr:ABC transporter ATP-binding protein [Planctomycetia bacterium]